MNPVLFQCKDIITDGKHLLGAYKWPGAVALTGAWLSIRPPSSGTLTLTLEIAGTPTDNQFSVAAGPSTPSMRLNLALDLVVAAGDLVRWVASYDGAPEDAATVASLVMTATEASVSPAPAVLSVWYSEGIGNNRTRFQVFSYDAATHSFTPESGLGTAQTGNTLTFSLPDGTLVMQVQAGVLSVPEFIVLGGVTPPMGTARLEFCRSVLGGPPIPMATLAADGLRVADLTEGTPPVLTSDEDGFYDRFELWSANCLTAVFTPTGMTVAAGVEF